MAFPGRGAARSGASQIRVQNFFDPLKVGPGSAAHHFMLRCARDTSAVPCHAQIAIRNPNASRVGEAGNDSATPA